MKHALIFLTALVLSACSSPLRKPAPADLAIRVDARLLRSCERFEKVTTEGLSEARLLHEYSRLSVAYTACFNNNEALIILINKELSNVK